ncbi:MAG: amidohydrolase [Dehalococcoidia bacterium]
MSRQTADLILRNANVLTMASHQPRAELVAVAAGNIVWVGSNSDVDLFEAGAKLIDCEGKTVIPGFNDAHIHIMAFASRLLSVDCSPASVASIEDIRHRIRQEAERIPRGTWIKATGYNEFYLSGRRHPTRHDLDQAAPHHPVKLTHRSLHACVLNSPGLSLAGITIETPDPPGGLIDREVDTGQPSGLLFGMNSYINEHVIPSLTEGELKQGVRLVNGSLLSSGITSVQDASVKNGFDQWQAFLKLRGEGELVPRVSMMFGLHALSDLKEHGLNFGYSDGGLRLGSVKITLDETRGQLNPSQEELNEEVLRANLAGFQVAIHAVEEGTVEAAAIALEYCLSRSPKADHRHRVEHCSVCPPLLLRRLRVTGTVVVTQPAFIYFNGERYLNEVSETQLPWLYRTRSFLKSELKPAASSDCPVVPCDPLTGVYAAVTRRAESGQVLSAEEAISPEEALKMYTLGGAYASFEERSKGSIEVGKLADMVVLSADPTGVAPDGIRKIQVERTIVGGEVVWEM